MRSTFIPLLMFILFSCKTEEPQTPPVVITSPATEITLTKAKMNGEVTNEGFSAASERGFVMSETNPKPSVSDIKYGIGYGKGAFSKELDNLKVNTKYYFSAFATNTKGTSYGEIMSFTTADYKLATITMEEPKNITYTSVQFTGTVTEDGGVEVSERGFCLNTSPNPTTSNIKIINGKGLGTFSTFVTELKDETSYYVRAYAINGKGISYGKEFTFKTLNYTVPTIETGNANSIGNTFVTMTGAVKNDGGTELIEKGFVVSTSPNPTIDNLKVISSTREIGRYEIVLTGIKANTVYYFKAYAINKKGIVFGSEESFTTLSASIAKVGTNDFSDITETTVRAGLEIENDGGSPIIEYGICYSSTNSVPTIGDKKVIFGYSVKPPFGIMNVITGLNISTKYYLRAYVINEKGIAYGSVKSFSTISPLYKNIKNELIAYYSFNGSSGDVSGNGNHGVNFGATLTNDRYNNTNSAYYFNRSYIDIGKLPGLGNSPTSFSVCAWVLTVKDQSKICKMPILTRRQIESDSWVSFGGGGNGTIGVPWNSQAYFFVDKSGYIDGIKNSTYSNSKINDGKWHFLVATKIGPLIKLYVDGILESTRSDNTSINSISNMYIGFQASWGFDCEKYFYGSLDDIGIWKRELTDDEVKYLYQNNFQP